MKCLIDNINNYNDLELHNFVYKINPIKRERLSKMNDNSFRESVVGEILLSKLLKEMNIDYEKIIIKYNENGKPFISNYPIYYNISHDHDLVICIISEYQIGVDILKMKDIKKNIAKSFCNEDEYKYIKNKYHFYQLYTLKEAYLKLFGKKINDIKFLNIIYDNHIKLNVPYRTFKTNNDYLVSICYLPK